MKMFVGRVGMLMAVVVDLDASGSAHRPHPDSDQEEPDDKLRPRRPRLKINNPSEDQPDAPDDDHADAVAETPEGTRTGCTGGVLDSSRRQRGEMIDTCEHVQTTGSETCEDRNHPGTIAREWQSATGQLLDQPSPST